MSLSSPLAEGYVIGSVGEHVAGHVQNAIVDGQSGRRLTCAGLLDAVRRAAAGSASTAAEGLMAFVAPSGAPQEDRELQFIEAIPKSAMSKILRGAA